MRDMRKSRERSDRAKTKKRREIMYVCIVGEKGSDRRIKDRMERDMVNMEF